VNYRINPKNGDKLSILGFGCMRFGGDSLGSSFTGRFDTQKAERLIKSAIDHGVNYFDTAYVYSGSEEVLGKTLAKYGVRDKAYIATKMPLILCRNKADLDKYFNRQLERLQTDFIDYYLLHMLTDMKTWNTLCEWGIKEWIAKKKATGQIRQFGFSFHGAQDEFLALLDAYDWDFVQIQYNYSDENFQAGVTGLKKAAEKGMAIMIMEPLLGGKLVSGLPKAAAERFNQENPGISPVAWAFRWLYNQPEATVVLSGMNEQSQLDENIKTAESAAPNMLSQAELDTFSDVKRIFNDSYKVHCTGCHYCMPCPHGVNIPACFTAYNTRYAISKSQAGLQYSMSTLMNDKPSYASLCKKCGLCEKHCPQNIPIRESLGDAAKEFETFGFKIMKFGTKFFVRKK
jgi:predicted aldo/keto reductase-like oxidoreductase